MLYKKATGRGVPKAFYVLIKSKKTKNYQVYSLLFHLGFAMIDLEYKNCIGNHSLHETLALYFTLTFRAFVVAIIQQNLRLIEVDLICTLNYILLLRL